MLIEKVDLMNQRIKRKSKKKKTLQFLIVETWMETWITLPGNATLEQSTENLDKTQIIDLKCTGLNLKNSMYSPQHLISNDIKWDTWVAIYAIRHLEVKC